MHGSHLQLTNILTISTSNCLNDLQGEDSKWHHEVVTLGEKICGSNLQITNIQTNSTSNCQEETTT